MKDCFESMVINVVGYLSLDEAALDLGLELAPTFRSCSCGIDVPAACR